MVETAIKVIKQITMAIVICVIMLPSIISKYISFGFDMLFLVLMMLTIKICVWAGYPALVLQFLSVLDRTRN